MLRRTELKRKVGLKRKAPLGRGSGLKRTGRLRKASKSPVAATKRRIQALLRLRVIERDGGCLLRGIEGVGACSQVLQAEHLVSRANSASYGDLRNVICLCQRHHIFWKPQNSRLYWELIEMKIGPERWEYVKVTEADRTPHRMTAWDWQEVERSLS
jgi:hypothetical protein